MTDLAAADASGAFWAPTSARNVRSLFNGSAPTRFDIAVGTIPTGAVMTARGTLVRLTHASYFVQGASGFTEHPFAGAATFEPSRARTISARRTRFGAGSRSTASGDILSPCSTSKNTSPRWSRNERSAIGKETKMSDCCFDVNGLIVFNFSASMISSGALGSVGLPQPEHRRANKRRS